MQSNTKLSIYDSQITVRDTKKYLTGHSRDSRFNSLTMNVLLFFSNIFTVFVLVFVYSTSPVQEKKGQKENKSSSVTLCRLYQLLLFNTTTFSRFMLYATLILLRVTSCLVGLFCNIVI